MNKVFLIGNGFDLAHELKTSYSDFLLWYINKTVRLTIDSKSTIYNDKLITLDSGNYRPSEFDSLNSFHDCLANKTFSFKSKYPFFNKIIRRTTDSNWVDIEYEYYLTLLAVSTSISRDSIGTIVGVEKFVEKLNNCFDLIKEQLVEYLHTLKNAKYSDQIAIHFKDELTTHSFNKVLFLVFNYTKTIEQYINSLNINNGQVINIHGQLGEDGNPIIFGYGDEMDEYYSKIESLNINEFLRNMKSFSYLKTNNYQNLNRFLDDTDFTVSIMGHSCGISDRVLLNSIFNHAHCRRIRVYYYQKNNDENDYFEKTLEISRHFPLEHKNKMRNLIVSFQDSKPLL